MTQIIRALDQSAMNAKQTLGMTNGVNGKSVQARPELLRILERGRQVFEREFGITLAKNSSTLEEK
jgi:hypothetical protein